MYGDTHIHEPLGWVGRVPKELFNLPPLVFKARAPKWLCWIFWVGSVCVGTPRFGIDCEDKPSDSSFTLCNYADTTRVLLCNGCSYTVAPPPIYCW